MGEGSIGPGDFVEALPTCDQRDLTPGSIYVVSEVRPPSICRSCRDPGPGVALEGIDCSGGEFCPACDVRPIYRRGHDFCALLREPLPDAVSPVPEPA